MKVTADTELPRYAEAVLPLLRKDPVRNNVLATLLQTRLDGMVEIEDELLLLRLLEESGPDDEPGKLVGVALRTPPRPLLMSTMPPSAVAALARYLATAHLTEYQYNGPADEVRALVDQIAMSTGGRPVQIGAHGMFQATQATLPFVIPGKPRAATIADRDLLVAWSAVFLGGRRRTGLHDRADPALSWSRAHQPGLHAASSARQRLRQCPGRGADFSRPRQW